MADQEQEVQYFYEVFLPFVLIVFVLFGLPWLVVRIEQHYDSVRGVEQVTPLAPAAESPSPPVSGTGPPVADAGGETG